MIIQGALSQKAVSFIFAAVRTETPQNERPFHVWYMTRPSHSSSLNLNSVKQLIFVMVKCGVLFEVWTEFLNNI
jgi:hypothetical protein